MGGGKCINEYVPLVQAERLQELDYYEFCESNRGKLADLVLLAC
jgi:hypothetical protein